MRLADTRPPFAGLANLSWEALASLPTPCYLLDEGQLRRNGELLLGVQQRTGCKILLAQKAFSNFNVYPVLAPYLAGTEASGLYESRLGKEELPEKENHVFCAAYRADEFAELLQYADHIVFNSPSQLAKFGPAAKAAGKSVGLRLNPECSTQEGHAIYDPCAPGSRLGTTRAQWDAALQQHPELPALLDGLHFHTLCEQNADALAETLPAVEAAFGDLLPRMKWLNFGGGHHITRPDYDLSLLEKCITGMQAKYGVQVYLEPGEAWALNAGYLVTTVLDTLQNGDTSLAILDLSAACHTPDVIEMPYRPPLLDAGEPGEKPCTVRLGGPTCLAGDVIGDYSFAAPLTEGQRLIFGDMAIYSTCKNNTFNGMPLPDIWQLCADGTLRRLAHFGYGDFKYRLGSRGGGSTDEQKEAAMLTALTSSPQCSETAKTNDPELRNMLLTDLNAQLKTGRFEGDVKVKGIKPHPEENITITVMTDYRNGERLQELIKMITDHIGRVYPSTNINVNANGCWTKVAVVVQSNEKGTYLAVAIQLKNLAYPQN